MERPDFSLILCVKNGLPYLTQAVDSIAAQTYNNFEVIVQDSKSTDGSLEYLRKEKRFANWSVVSESDAGIGDAYNRAVQRCRGAIIGSIDADNLLKPNALADVRRFLHTRDDVACVYGSVEMISGDGATQSVFEPADFDYLSLLQCELVPPFSTSFFVSDRCGPVLNYDAELETCADYDLWLRICHLPVVRIPTVLGCTRLSDNSMTCQPNKYEQFVRDKIFALERHCAQQHRGGLRDSLVRKGSVGVYAWAAESVFAMTGPEELYKSFCERGFAVDRSAWRLHYHQQVYNFKQLQEQFHALRKAS